MRDRKTRVVRPPTVKAQSVARVLALHVEFAWRHRRDEADRWGFDLAGELAVLVVVGFDGHVHRRFAKARAHVVFEGEAEVVDAGQQGALVGRGDDAAHDLSFDVPEFVGTARRDVGVTAFKADDCCRVRCGVARGAELHECCGHGVECGVEDVGGEGAKVCACAHQRGDAGDDHACDDVG